MNFANIHIDNAELGKALSYLRRSLKIAEGRSDEPAKAHAHIHLGRYFCVCDNLRHALDHYYQALIIAVDIKDKSIAMQAHQGLNECYRRLGSFQLALEHCERSHEIEKELFTLEQDKKIKQLNTQFEVEKTIQEKAIAESRHALIRNKNNELSEALQKVQTLNNQLIDLNRQKIDVIGVVAHNLRSPLAGIKLTCENALAYYQKISKRGLAQQVAEIENVCVNILGITSNLLKVQMLERGKLEVDKENVDICRCLRELLNSYRAAAAAKKITFYEDYSHNGITAIADYNVATQIFDNIVSNALKFSPPGSHVTVRTQRNRRTVQVDIEDQGPGLTIADQSELYGQYAKLSAQPTGSETSAGLGLWIVKQLVESLDGTIQCTSAPGKGAVFSVKLPAWPPDIF